MDWKSRFEEEDRQKAQAKEQEEMARAAEAARFKPFSSRIGPLLEKEIADVRSRLGIQLSLYVGQTEITVAAPKHRVSTRQSSFPYSFTLDQSDGSSVRARAINDQRSDRNPDEWPDDMSYGDYFGSKDIIVDVRETLDDLESGDLALLMEWLVGIYRSGAASVPQLRGLKQVQAEEHRRQFFRNLLPFTAGGGFLGFLIFGFSGCCIRVFRGYRDPFEPFEAWQSEALIGSLVGIIWGIFAARK